jgi:hypothetical protein
MALKSLNSEGGFGLANGNAVIDANGNFAASNLVVSGTSNLGPVANVTITGGSNGQVLVTDGNGVLSFTNSSSNSAAPMPYLIPNGESYIVKENFQGFFFEPITINGEFEVDGILIDLSGNGNGGGGGNGTPGGNTTELQYNNSGSFAGIPNVTFSSGNLSLGSVSNVKITGGNANQYLQTDGTGNLTWANVTGGSANVGGNTTEIQYNNSGNFAGSANFTFDNANNIVNVPELYITGNIIPTANITYDLGSNSNRFNDLYLAGNTIELGNASMSTTATALVFTNPQGGTFTFSG